MILKVLNNIPKRLDTTTCEQSIEWANGSFGVRRLVNMLCFVIRDSHWTDELRDLRHTSHRSRRYYIWQPQQCQQQDKSVASLRDIHRCIFFGVNYYSEMLVKSNLDFTKSNKAHSITFWFLILFTQPCLVWTSVDSISRLWYSAVIIPGTYHWNSSSPLELISA